jgi:anti-anti-sigma factor
MEVKTEKIDGLDVVYLSGRLDSSNASVFDENMKGILSRNPAKVVVSLKGLQYVSSAGLRIFLAAAKEIKKCGGSLAFAEPQEPVIKVLKMSSLDTILKIYNSMDEAMCASQPG